MNSLEKIISATLSILINLSPKMALADGNINAIDVENAARDTLPPTPILKINKIYLETINNNNKLTSSFDYNNDEIDDIYFDYKNHGIYIRWNDLTKKIKDGEIDYTNFQGFGITKVLNSNSPESLNNFTYFSLLLYNEFKSNINSDIAILEIDESKNKMALIIPNDNSEVELSSNLHFNPKTKFFIYSREDISEGQLVLIAQSRQNNFEKIIRTYPVELKTRLKDIEKDKNFRKNAEGIKTELELKLGVENKYEENIIKAIHKKIMLDYIIEENNSIVFAYNNSHIIKKEALKTPKKETPLYKKPGFIISTASATVIGTVLYFLLKGDNDKIKNNTLKEIKPEISFQDINGK